MRPATIEAPAKQTHSRYLRQRDHIALLAVHQHEEIICLCRPADYADRGVNGLVGGVWTVGWST